METNAQTSWLLSHQALGGEGGMSLLGGSEPAPGLCPFYLHLVSAASTPVIVTTKRSVEKQVLLPQQQNCSLSAPRNNLLNSEVTISCQARPSEL